MRVTIVEYKRAYSINRSRAVISHCPASNLEERMAKERILLQKRIAIIDHILVGYEAFGISRMADVKGVS